LQLSSGAPLGCITCLTAPTPTVRPALGRGTVWRLISHLALNHLSLFDSELGAEPIREILKLYDVSDSAETRGMIEGVLNIRSQRVVDALREGQPPDSAAAWRSRYISTNLDSAAAAFTCSRPYWRSFWACMRPSTPLPEWSPRPTSARRRCADGRPSRRASAPLIDQLLREPYRFGFFQAVRVLERAASRLAGEAAGRKPVGQDYAPRDEVVRFQGVPSHTFPPCDILSLTPGEPRRRRPAGPYQMMVSFLGMTGPAASYPALYTAGDRSDSEERLRSA